MSKAGKNIIAGLEEALAFAKGDKTKGTLYTFSDEINVAEIRKKIGLSQPQFAKVFHISLGTLRHWEQGDRKPRGPALILLHIIAKHPETVLDVLK